MPIDLEKIEDSTQLLDLLVQMEDVLDSLDIYVYRNWFSGEVVEGPIVQRHFVSMSLLYPNAKMPDPRAALKLLKHGVQVEFNHMERAKANKQQLEGNPAGSPAAPVPPATQAGMNVSPHLAPPEASKPQEWLIKLRFPRRILDQIDAADLETYEDDVDEQDVTDAKDAGLTDDTGYEGDEASPNGDPNAPPDGSGSPEDDEQQPPGPPGGGNANG